MDKSEEKRKRNVHGLVLLQKPTHCSSNDALQSVKRLFQAKKAGHTGSLDPLASGLLVVCFGEATKVTGFLLDASKRYRVTAKLGEQTTTGDAEGALTAQKPVLDSHRDRLQDIVATFVGPSEQVPPMYSAIKHKGQRLYALARKGIEVEREPRAVTIYALTIIGQTEDTVSLDVCCSKGTYIRTLVEDIGHALGCGAHTIALHRIGVGPFQDEGQFLTLEALTALREQGQEVLDDVLLPMEHALDGFADVQLSAQLAQSIQKGQAVQVARAPAQGLVRLFSVGAFLGIGKILGDGRVAPKRLVNFFS